MREEKPMTKEEMREEENKELKGQLEKVLKIISIPIDGFKDKSDKELISMQRDIEELDRRAMRYTFILKKIQKFNYILDSFNRKDDYETMFEIYRSEIQEEDDIPF